MNKKDIEFIDKIMVLSDSGVSEAKSDIDIANILCHSMFQNGGPDMEKLPDLKTELEERLSYHLEQIRQLKAAISALGPKESKATNGTVSAERKRIPWQGMIKKLFNENRGRAYSPQDVKEIFIRDGYTELEGENYKNTIYTTLRRLVDNGVLEKVGTGLYQYREKYRRKAEESEIKPSEDGSGDPFKDI